MTRSCAGQAARDLEPRPRRHPARVDQRGEREHLLHGAGLVGQVDRPRAAVLGRVAGRIGGVERRVVGVGEDLAGPGVHDHRDPGVAAGLAHGVAQHPLGVPLEVAVDRGVQVRAVDGLDGLVGAERDPVAAADLVAGFAVLAREVLVEDLLQPAERLVGAHEPDQVRRHVVRRVVAHRVTLGPQALDPAGVGLGDHVVGERGGDPPGDVLEPAALVAEPVEGVDVVDGEPLREEPGDRRGAVRGLRRVRHHHQPVHRVRERLAVAVEDVAALGGEAPPGPSPRRPPSRRTNRGRRPAAARAGHRRPRAPSR